MATRTTGAIALRPISNAQRGYFLYSLSTGRVLNRNHWTPLPMPQDVIDRVHTLARRAAASVALTFADRTGEVIPDYDDDDDDNDADYIPGAEDDDEDEAEDYPFDEDDDDAPDDAGHIAGVEGYYPPNIGNPAPEPNNNLDNIGNDNNLEPNAAEHNNIADNDADVAEDDDAGDDDEPPG